MDQQAVGTLTDTGQVQQLTAVRTTLAAAVLKLFKSSFVPNRDSVIGDFDSAECDFNGYAAETLTWSAVGIDGQNNARIVGSQAFFQATDELAPNTVGGAWLEDAGGDLWAFWQFGTPVPLNVALAFAAVTVVYGAGGPVTADVES